MDLVDTTLTFNNSSTAGSARPSRCRTAMHHQQHHLQRQRVQRRQFANITNVSSYRPRQHPVRFLGASTAGSATITNNAGIGSGGQLQFGTLGGTDTANAGTATIINNNLGTTSFLAHTSAMNAAITNNSGGNTNFQDQSTAANATIINNNGGTTGFGVPIVGTDTATAGSAHITNNAGGTTLFTAATTAGNATIVNNVGGFLQFGDSGAGSSTATAGNATITNSGTTSFNALTTAGSSTLTTNSGGNVFFFDSSTGGSARFITNAGGTFDMSGLTATGMTAGSIEGAGNYVLGSKTLTVGSNNLSTAVSGVISGVGGTLIKVGTGTLTLSNTDTYTGQPAERRQHGADQFLQRHRRHSENVVFGHADADAGLTQASGELATGSQQTTFDAMNLFMGVMTDPFVAGRGDGPSAAAVPAAMPMTASAYAAKAQAERCLCRDLSPRRRRRRSSSAGACGRRASAARRPPTAMPAVGSNNTTSSRRHRGRRRLSLLAVYDRRLCAGRRRHQLQRRQQRQRPVRPVPGRRLRPAHRVGPAYISGALAYGWQDITTNRTVTAPAPISCAPSSTPTPFGPPRRRLSFCRPWVGRRRHHALRRRPVHHLRSAGLCRKRSVRRQHVCAGLWRQERHRSRSELGIRTDKSFAMQDGV
jgi:hypothetical protein